MVRIFGLHQNDRYFAQSVSQRYDPKQMERGPIKSRPDYHQTTRAIVSMNKEASQTQESKRRHNYREDLDREKLHWLKWLSHIWKWLRAAQEWSVTPLRAASQTLTQRICPTAMQAVSWCRRARVSRRRSAELPFTSVPDMDHPCDSGCTVKHTTCYGKPARTKMVCTKTFWTDGIMIANTASLCQISGGLRNRSFHTMKTHWKTSLTLLHNKKGFVIQSHAN